MGTKQHQGLGAYGERVAARHLTALGMTVIDHNWRCLEGEIDLVLRDGAVLVVCEVKTRRGVEFGHPLEAVDAIKVDRLHRLAMLWQEQNGLRAAEIRFDAVGVLLPLGGAAEVSHVRGMG